MKIEKPQLFCGMLGNYSHPAASKAKNRQGLKRNDKKVSLSWLHGLSILNIKKFTIG